MIYLHEILTKVNLARMDIPSQVTISERKVLKYLASSEMPNARIVVDLGSGAGSAALAMAEGFASRSNPFPTMHAYDWFSLGPGHFATAKFKAVSASDDASFLEDFKYFLQPYLEHIRIHSGDIKTEKWKDGFIDLLFVDLCKDLAIFNHVATEFFGSIKPGSFFIHQDFSRPRLPWLHYSAGLMESVLEPLMRTGGSVFYRAKQTPSTDMIAEVTDRDMSIEKRKAMARRGIENAASIQNQDSQHFSCLKELTDIYIDYWFDSRRVAKERFNKSSYRHLFEKFYPELTGEIAA